MSEMWVWSFGGIIWRVKSEGLDMKPSLCHLSATNLTSADRDRILDSAGRDRQLITLFFVNFWHDSSQLARTSSFTRFLDNTQWRAKSVGLLCTSDQLVAETSTWRHTTLTTDRHPCPGGIRKHSLRKRAAVHPRLRPRGHWNRQLPG
jgi:hypothetical protein